MRSSVIGTATGGSETKASDLWCGLVSGEAVLIRWPTGVRLWLTTDRRGKGLRAGEVAGLRLGAC